MSDNKMYVLNFLIGVMAFIALVSAIAVSVIVTNGQANWEQAQAIHGCQSDRLCVEIVQQGYPTSRQFAQSSVVSTVQKP